MILFEKYPNVRYFGIPSGHEFTPFLHVVKMASLGQVELPEAVEAKVIELDKPVDIKVFVTPTCPYCKGPVLIGHMMGILNSKVTSTMVEAMEYRELAMKNQVAAVPKIVINDDKDISAEGSISPQMMLELIEKAQQR